MCPICGDRDVGKAVMAPAVAAKGNRRHAPDAGRPGRYVGGSDEVRALMHAQADAQARALRESQWVGDKFAERARAMHYGEADQAPIHGTANLDEARAMLEEGLAVAPLLVPVVPPDRAN